VGGGDGTIPPLKSLRNLIILCVLALALAVSIFLAVNWRKTGWYGPSKTVPKIEADLEFGNLFLTEEKDGTIRWELKARIAQSFKKGNETLLEDLQVILHKPDGGVVTLEGDRGWVDDKTRDMEVSGGVVVTSSDGLCLRTDSLHYDHRHREISTEDPVRIDGKGVRISGVGLLMDLNEERISVLGGVETLIHDVSLKSG
jgi:LPS export ABC transporter protein LptC